MNKIIIGLVLASAVSAQADLQEKIKINPQDLVIQTPQATRHGVFAKIHLAGFELSREVGAPELPVKSWLVAGRPESIEVNVKVGESQRLENLRPAPVEPQDCRCDVPKKVVPFSLEKYNSRKPLSKVTYLGAFRGQPISRVDVQLASYDADSNSVQLRKDVQINISQNGFEMPRGEYRDYLILAPAQLVAGVSDFVSYKQNQGYNVIVETLQAPQNTLQGISALVKKHYKDSGTDFVMIIGDETMVPMHKVETTGDYNTPSDLKYYTMDGADDHIPDMFASRIAATTAQAVKNQLQKAIEFEQKSYVSSAGLNKVIGIASNEGSSPSDKDYIQAIEKEFVTGMGAEGTFLYQNDAATSNPKFLNNKLDIGAVWLTYIGHGSGTSWPNLNQSYSTTNIKQLRNQPAVKPVIIDVACMNGKLAAGFMGTTFLEVGAANFGAAAYFGGSVNISWHPPAVMARGIAIEHMKNNFKHIGEALLAGQLYLASNWNFEDDVIDNFEWYHLQGDPGMNVQFK